MTHCKTFAQTVIKMYIGTFGCIDKCSEIFGLFQVIGMECIVKYDTDNFKFCFYCFNHMFCIHQFLLDYKSVFY